MNFDAFILVARCAAGSITRLLSTLRLVGEEFAVLLGGILTILLLFVPKLFGTSWREPGTGDGADVPPHLPALSQGMLKGLPWLSLAAVSSALLCLTNRL